MNGHLGGTASNATRRCFVAAVPPPPVAAALARIVPPGTPGLRMPPVGQLHATLRFLGDADPAALVTALRAAALPRVTARVGPALQVLARVVVVASVAGLEPLATGVDAVVRGLGHPPDPQPFLGHVTLARAASPSAANRWAGTPVAAAFEVTEVHVVASELRPEGARHTLVGTVALEAA